MAVDPEFAQGRRFVYVFSASNLATAPRTNRVIRVKVSDDWSSVSERVDIVRDIAFKEAARLGGPGAHSGGRLCFGPDGYLWINARAAHRYFDLERPWRSLVQGPDGALWGLATDSVTIAF